MKIDLKSNVSWWISALVLVISCLIPLIVFEWSLQTGVMKDEANLLKDPDHRMPPNDSDYETNSDGLRSTIEASEISEDDFTIFFMGDSFINGHCLPRESSIPYKLERMLNKRYPERRIRVVNAAWMSSSPLLALRLLKEMGAKYKSDMVLYGMDMTDFRDDYAYHNMLETPGIWKLAPITPALFVLISKATKKICKKFDAEHVYRAIYQMPSDPFFLSTAPWQDNEFWLTKIQSNLNEIYRTSRDDLHVPFALIALPRSYQYSDKECPYNWEKDSYEVLGKYAVEPFKFLDHLKTKVDYPIYSLLQTFQNTDVFPTTFQNDPHYNDNGATVAAEAIFKIAEENSWIESEKPAL